jgi:hypothetical protein
MQQRRQTHLFMGSVVVEQNLDLGQLAFDSVTLLSTSPLPKLKEPLQQALRGDSLF